MFIEVLVISILISKFSGGNIINIWDVKINKLWIISLGIVLEFIGMVCFYRLNIENIYFIKYINILSYLIFIIGLSYNSELKGFKVLILGSVLNFIPLLINQGKMPVSMKALEILGNYRKIDLLFAEKIFTHSLANESTKLKILIDFIPISKPQFLAKVISIGDIIISFGIFLFIYGISNIKKEE